MILLNMFCYNCLVVSYYIAGQWPNYYGFDVTNLNLVYFGIKKNVKYIDCGAVETLFNSLITLRTKIILFFI